MRLTKEWEEGKEEMKEEEEQKEEKAFLRYWRERKGKTGTLMAKIHEPHSVTHSPSHQFTS